MKRLFSRQTLAYVVVFVGAALLTAGVAALLVNINQRKTEEIEYPLKIVEIEEGELEPSVWGQNFPRQYDRFVRTQENYGQTPYGGGDPYNKLDRYPAMRRMWAGYAFAEDFNEERGHHYALTDQKETKRTHIVQQPGACANCHSGDAPRLIAELGWEEFNKTPYDELRDDLHYASTCNDCHNPDTMELRITRPAFVNAMEARGIDLSTATRQEMRTYVCAQCHVEYYFAGENKVLTFPWTEGLTINDIQTYYDNIEFKDWSHKETGAPMLKMQHPEFELWSTGIHARSGVSCADCHMPYMREGGVKISDHWIRSPLTNLNTSCQTCHKWPEEELRGRVLEIQDRTANLLRRIETASIAAIDAIVAAREAGATDEQLAQALQYQRYAGMRWDFISSENSTGFHSPQEAARVLAEGIDYARQAELIAVQVMLGLDTEEVNAGANAETVSLP